MGKKGMYREIEGLVNMAEKVAEDIDCNTKREYDIFIRSFVSMTLFVLLFAMGLVHYVENGAYSLADEYVKIYGIIFIGVLIFLCYYQWLLFRKRKEVKYLLRKDRSMLFKLGNIINTLKERTDGEGNFIAKKILYMRLDRVAFKQYKK